MIGEVVFVLGAGAGIYLLVKQANGGSSKSASIGTRTGGSTTGKVPKKSLLVTFVNAAGVSTNSDDLAHATAELAGRATGGVARQSARGGRRAKQTLGKARRHLWRKWKADGAPRWRATRARARDSIVTRWRRTWAAVKSRRRPAEAAQTAKPATASPPAQDRSPAPAKPAPGPSPPWERHLKAVPDPPPTPNPPLGDAVTTTDETPAPTTLAAPDAPPDWGLMADRIRNFAPEDDTALIAFMRGESVGILAYAEALEQARDNCVNEVGLDPSAVAGFTTYSEHVSEAAQRMAEAYKTFVAVYGEVQQLAASGVVMPFKGRFFTGEAG